MKKICLGIIIILSCNNKIYNLPDEMTNFIIDNTYVPCVELYDGNGDFFGCHNENCIDINDICYDESEINFLLNLIGENNSLDGTLPLNVGNQRWAGGRLRSLNLSNLELNYIPENIASLKVIDTLILKNNQLNGFPDKICDLIDNYCYINSDSNQICNPFPDCILYVPNQECAESLCPANYTELSNQCFYEPDLDVLIDIITMNESVSTFDDLDLYDQDWDFGKLKSIKLEGKGLTSIPESIINLTGLRRIELANNELTEIPSFIGEMNSLRKIDFSNNLLLEIPDFIGELTNLRVLRFSQNEIEIIPKNITEINTLRELKLGNNQLSTIPDEIGNLSNLRHLYLNDNNIENIPLSICNLSCECEINLDNNRLCIEYDYDCLIDIGDQDTTNCQ